ncbi:hypothetical protein PoB_001449400 [Plakobranchus ocellatus]|uniref:Uncharacterized protein n=1 Tax=Plakobranchus ocellatus TaxID=259542 RepID=A0AAV3YY61_9GAST|nr:hypothetical protein PoB_001449400 [Plakobranchus ocellatus]
MISGSPSNQSAGCGVRTYDRWVPTNNNRSGFIIYSATYAPVKINMKTARVAGCSVTKTYKLVSHYKATARQQRDGQLPEYPIALTLQFPFVLAVTPNQSRTSAPPDRGSLFFPLLADRRLTTTAGRPASVTLSKF